MPPLPEIDYWSVPRCWPGEVVAILGGGRSMRQEQVDYLQGKCRVIAINRAGIPPMPGKERDWVWAPWADWLYGCDGNRFWQWHPEALEFAGTKVTLRGARYMTPEWWRQVKRLADAGVKVLRHSGRDYPQMDPRHIGISRDPAVVHGDNSAFQLLSIVAHTGATTVLLLGVDQHGRHWHGGYDQIGSPDYGSMCQRFATLAAPLAKAGVEVLNVSPGSALDCFPRARLEEVI
jgi:hypothetical protein